MKSVTVLCLVLLYIACIHGTDIEENKDSDKDLISLYNVLKLPTHPVGCVAQNKSWDQAMDCIECGLNSCVTQCRNKEQLPTWFKTCYDKTQWTPVFDDLSRCLNNKTEEFGYSCIRLPPLSTVLKAFDRKQIQSNKLLTNLQNKVTMNDIACFGVCAFSATTTCLKNDQCPLSMPTGPTLHFFRCDRFNGTSYSDHPASSCFASSNTLLNSTVNEFLTCINHELE